MAEGLLARRRRGSRGQPRVRRPARDPGRADADAGPLGQGRAGAASDLAGQNDLFIEGTQAWHRGDGQAALGAFDQLLARYPGGQLAENASVQRMRVLRSIAPERAASSARDYLGRYPSGYARAEAEAVLQAGSP